MLIIVNNSKYHFQITAVLSVCQDKAAADILFILSTANCGGSLIFCVFVAE